MATKGPNSLFTSFRNLKINFNEFLGEGRSGYVYGVIERPENERGFFAEWFPFLYDFIFRPKEEVKSRECVKIAKPFLLQVFAEIREGNELFLARPIHSFFAMSQDVKRNALLTQYGLSKIQFKKISCSIYSQVQTKVNGFTIHQLCARKAFINKDFFLMRKLLVEFLIKLKGTPLSVEDVHRDNIMYDVELNAWEIIDGNVQVDHSRTKEKTNNEMKWLFDIMFRNVPNYMEQFRVFEILENCVINEQAYTELTDVQTSSRLVNL